MFLPVNIGKSRKLIQNLNPPTEGEGTYVLKSVAKGQGAIDKRIILLSRLAAIIVVLLSTGCSSIHTKTPEGESIVMNEADFAAYFEHVFRHHNSVVNESLYVSTSTLDKGDDPVLIAEMKMDHAFQPLNEVASAAATGQSADFWTKMKLGDAVPECEAATRILEKLLSTEK